MKDLCITLLVLMLSACAMAHGTKIDAAALSALTIGQTSIKDVEDRFGAPTSTNVTSDGTTILGYRYVPRLSADAFPFVETVAKDDADKKQTVSLVFFNGMLKSYSKT